MIESHLAHMLIYSVLASVAFALVSRDTAAERRTFGLKLFGIMTLGSLLLAWLMYPFPRT